MTVFLAENEIATDNQSIGFPSLGSCMALVVQTKTALYGYHVFGLHVPERTVKLAQRITQSEPSAEMVHLYGTCHWPARYAWPDVAQQETAWRNEMDGIATSLNYHGPVTGFNTGARATAGSITKHLISDISTTATTYVEYRRRVDVPRCEIYYKRMSKMQTTRGPAPADTPIQTLERSQTGSGNYYLVAPTNQITLTAHITPTPDNDGRLHEAPSLFTYSFKRL
jgi:hypothetical protein